MPPKRAKAKTSTSSTVDAIPAASPPALEHSNTTPQQSPQKKQKEAGITQAQKQALIDNLQLEITERARKLRAQYALQAQGLRARLEMRVNRIPQALRKRKMQDLLDEHAEKMDPKPAESVAVVQEDDPQIENEEPRRRSLKRSSDQISTTLDPDKENTNPSADLANPKKRAKTTTTNAPATKANTKATRTASTKAPPLTVLSPKSHNSRTLPHSPFKQAGPNNSPEKPFPRPATAPAAKRTTSRQQTAAAKKNVQVGSETEGRDSEASNTSAGTTIVKKSGGGGKGRVTTTTGTAKKAATAAAAAARAGPKKQTAAQAKKENVPPAPAPATANANAGGRSLRKRV